jgi:hypothetical protein
LFGKAPDGRIENFLSKNSRIFELGVVSNYKK